ncbi:hypothetical protein BDY21DRAFT_128620 [Lineolata rhizophorae]|uniref:CDP-alcohol phosphatidyltransferase-domain-containing protein n=1 Tax=Lineolata rhizophorae TaxID=578093 RepID=A0A6A6NPK3_9PEZI|nr:hypothetical protein BDY21DRAFT_128620 [Lineolata rhizophorae]
MLDIQLRPLKDQIFDPLCSAVPHFIQPLHLTLLAFGFGIICCVSAANGQVALSLFSWVLNRTFDCLDGAVARRRNIASDLGGFLDLFFDFIVYCLIPISCATYFQSSPHTWISIAVLESTFHINNFVLFYIAAILEKRKTAGRNHVKELTSVAMRPALVEGFESALLFTLMLAYPELTEHISWTMASLVAVGTLQRVYWLCQVLN